MHVSETYMYSDLLVRSREYIVMESPGFWRFPEAFRKKATSDTFTSHNFIVVPSRYDDAVSHRGDAEVSRTLFADPPRRVR